MLESEEQRIEHFAKQFNSQQVHLYKQSLQYHMRQLSSNKEKLLELQRRLEETKTFIDTPAKMIEQLKKIHYETNILLHSNLSEPSNLLKEAILQSQTAYDVKLQVLIELRKKAKDDIIAMFDPFILLRIVCTDLSVLRFIFTNYMKLIFDALVLIHPYIVKVAFKELRNRFVTQ